AVIVCAVLALVNRSSLKAWFQAALSGATAAATVAIGTAICGVIVKAVVMTGLVTKLPGIVESLSGGRILVALVLTMIISIILGMGVPTTPAYIIVAIMAAPILVGMGVELVAAHMFVFYFAVMSMLTPPVAPAAIIASQIAGASYLKTAVECVKPAIIGFLIPFIFVANPVFLAQPSAPLWSTIAVIATLLILLSAQVALVGQYFTILSQLQRWLFLICAIVLFVSIVIIKSYLIFAVGAALFLLLTAGQMQKWLRIKRQLASATV
ncbi:MAG: TRAP transporter large permease subunit, partial [Chloroflexota bacterium]